MGLLSSINPDYQDTSSPTCSNIYSLFTSSSVDMLKYLLSPSKTPSPDPPVPQIIIDLPSHSLIYFCKEKLCMLPPLAHHPLTQFQGIWLLPSSLFRNFFFKITNDLLAKSHSILFDLSPTMAPNPSQVVLNLFMTPLKIKSDKSCGSYSQKSYIHMYTNFYKFQSF